MSIRTRFHAALWAVAAATAACGSSDTAAEGRYALDKDAFIETAVQQMLEHDRIPEGSEDIARGMLRQIEMEFELHERTRTARRSRTRCRAHSKAAS